MNSPSGAIQVVSWIPAYDVAKALAEVRKSSEPYLHLVHPHPSAWHDLISPIGQMLNVPLVSYATWLSALAKSVEGSADNEVEMMKANPALRLLSFFTATSHHMTKEREAAGLVHLSTEKALAVSRSLGRVPKLDAEQARAWVEAWRRSGFL